MPPDARLPRRPRCQRPNSSYWPWHHSSADPCTPLSYEVPFWAAETNTCGITTPHARFPGAFTRLAVWKHGGKNAISNTKTRVRYRFIYLFERIPQWRCLFSYRPAQSPAIFLPLCVSSGLPARKYPLPSFPVPRYRATVVNDPPRWARGDDRAGPHAHTTSPRDYQRTNAPAVPVSASLTAHCSAGNFPWGYCITSVA